MNGDSSTLFERLPYIQKHSTMRLYLVKELILVTVGEVNVSNLFPQVE